MNRTIAVAIKPRITRVIKDLKDSLSIASLKSYTHLSYVDISDPTIEILNVEISPAVLTRLETTVANAKSGNAPAQAPVPAQADTATPAQPKPFSILDTFNPTHIKVLEASIANNTPVLLIGHTGLGKTTLIKEVANKNGKNLIRLSVHSGVTTDEILGKWVVEQGSMVWQDGLLVQAMKNGDYIVFDEINACPADVLFAMHALLDDDRHVTLLEKRGEVVRPVEGFRFFATMNPQDDYAGTKEINMAFMSRFNAVIEIEAFAQSVEITILESKGIPKKFATELVSTASKLRQFKANDEIMYFCGTRDIINTGLLLKSGLDMKEAIHYGIFNKMSTDDKEFVAGKIPDANFKTAEQQRIEQLEKYLNTEKQNTNQLRTQIQSQTTQITKLLQDAKNGGGTNLDAKTQKALKILGVLK